jgi:quinol monooxygenase YgiN
MYASLFLTVVATSFTMRPQQRALATASVFCYHEYMIHTNLEAIVEPQKWKNLEEAYFKIERKTLPEALLSSHLIQDESEPKLWRIVTFWRSRQDMDEYRKSVEVPAWILVFRAADAEPTLSISEVIISK